jgi:putative intracellular protease/amidase
MPKRRILIVVSEFGYWGEELGGPLEVFDAASYEVDFLTPTGKRAVALPVSLDDRFVDPPLGRTVVSKEMAAKSAALDDPTIPTRPSENLTRGSLPTPTRAMLNTAARGLFKA